MGLESFASESGKALGPRSIVSLLPSALLASLVFLLRVSGAPGEPHISNIERFFGKPGPGEVVLLLVVVTVATMILQPFQITVVQLLEGYWDGSPATSRLAGIRTTLADIGKELQRRRYSALQLQEAKPSTGVSREQMRVTSDELRYYPEDEADLMPTRLGNVLRAAENRAGGRYGLATNKLYPRLYSFLKEPLARGLDDYTDQLDLAAHLCVAMLLGSVSSLALLIPNAWNTPWMLVPVGCLALAWLAYRAALTAARQQGELLETAFDLHRFDLIAALHFPLPADPDEEYDFNRKLSRLLAEMETSTREQERKDKHERVPRIEYLHPEGSNAASVDWKELLGTPDRVQLSEEQ